MHPRTLSLAFACLSACVLPAYGEFDAGGPNPAKPIAARPSPPAFGADVANARPRPQAHFTKEFVVAVRFAGAARVAFAVVVIPAPAPSPSPPVIKNPSNVPRQRH